MLGHKAREFKQHKSISLEDLVPADNFYRKLNEALISVLFVSWLPHFIPTLDAHP